MAKAVLILKWFGSDPDGSGITAMLMLAQAAILK
jgi:hypothetical protein